MLRRTRVPPTRSTPRPEALYTLGVELTRELDLGRLLELLARRAAEAMGAAAGTVFLWDETTGRLVPRAGHGPEAAGQLPCALGERLAGRVAERREAELVDEPPAASSPGTEGGGVATALAAPLLCAGRLLGVLTLRGDSSSRRFTPPDLEAFSRFAPQAAIAIENARLHGEAVSRARQLQTLHKLAQALTAVLDTRQVAGEILQALRVLFPDTFALLWGRGEETETLRLVEMIGCRRGDSLVRRRLRFGEGLVGLVAATRKPIVSVDLARDPRVVNPALVLAEGAVSCAILPLVHRDRLVGVLSVLTHQTHRFTPEELDLLASFAVTAAISIENARLYAAAQQEVAERAQAEAALREKTEELDRLFTLTLDLLCIAGTDGRFRRVNPAWSRLLGYRPDELEGQALLDYVHPDDRQVTQQALAALAEGREVLDFINRYRAKDGSYRWIEWRSRPYAGNLIFAAARDVTDRRRAEEALRLRTRQLEALRMVGEELARELDIAKLLTLIVRRAVELVGATGGTVFLPEGPDGPLTARASTRAQDWLLQLRFRRGEGVAGQVAERGTGLTVNDYRTWPGANPLVLAHSRVTAVVGEPLIYREQLVGVVVLDSEDESRPFTGSDRQTLALFAAQAAVAIENARLYEAARRRADQLALLNEIGRTLTTTLDPERVAEQILVAVQTLYCPAPSPGCGRTARKRGCSAIWSGST